MTRVVHRQCTLCEAHCGINVEVEGGEAVRIAGDPEDASRAATSAPRRRRSPTSRATPTACAGR